MTVVVGFNCDEGIVIASDSQMSLGFTKHTKQKVWASGNLAFGVSGAESTTDLLADYFMNSSFDTTTAQSIRTTIADAVDQILKPEYERVLKVLPPTLHSNADNLPQGAALVGMYANDGSPHLFALMGLGQVIDHASRGFASIGSGYLFAEHAMATFSELQDGMSLHQAKMLAYRIVETTITAAGAGIGAPVQMATLEPGSPPTAQSLPNDDPAIVDAVEGWKALETERFHKHAPLD